MPLDWGRTMLLLIDNYDSFTYNLYHYLGELGAEIIVRRNDELDVQAAMALNPAAILLSPGPCYPDQAGICLALTAAAAETRTPLLGVCLGHQAIGQAFGGDVVRAGEIVHGKLGTIRHQGRGVFAGLPSPFQATRYHSLVVDRATLPAALEVTAELEDGTIMGLQHRTLPVHGVQFHPEFDRLRARPGAARQLPRARRPAHARRGMSDRLRPLIGRAAEGPLSREQAETAFTAIMDGDATPAQVGGFLMALRTRGETVAEYAAAAAVMRARCLRVRAPEGAMDIVGTGGDGKGTLNISTAAALVVAGCGVPVAKHGNRNLSSKSGAADALTELGVNVMVGPEVVEKALAEAGIGFMMAPMHHPATRHVMPARQELGTRTIFNLLGPLTNPASVRRQLSGAYSRAVIRPMAETLGQLGSDRAWLVHGADGTDEVSIAGETYVAELNDGQIREFSVHPEDAGLSPHPLSAVLGGTPAENARALRAVLAGAPSAYRDAVLLNAAAALLVAERAADLREGVALAAESLDSGAARGKAEQLAAITSASTAEAP